MPLMLWGSFPAEFRRTMRFASLLLLLGSRTTILCSGFFLVNNNLVCRLCRGISYNFHLKRENWSEKLVSLYRISPWLVTFDVFMGRIHIFHFYLSNFALHLIFLLFVSSSQSSYVLQSSLLEFFSTSI